MANAICAKPLQGETMRVTRLDECGNPEYGDDAYGVSDGFISVTMTPEVEEGESFFIRNAAGRAIIDERSLPDLRWYTVTMVFQEVDPELFAILTGLDPYLDYSGQSIGFAVTKAKFATANFALELWMGNAEEACLPGDPYPWYGYNLLPWLVEGALMEDIAVTNAAINFTVVARTRTGTPWGVGPYDVMRDQTDAPAPLPVAIETDTHHLPIWTQLAPPEAICGTAGLSS